MSRHGNEKTGQERVKEGKTTSGDPRNAEEELMTGWGDRGRRLRSRADGRRDRFVEGSQQAPSCAVEVAHVPHCCAQHHNVGTLATAWAKPARHDCSHLFEFLPLKSGQGGSRRSGPSIGSSLPLHPARTRRGTLRTPPPGRAVRTTPQRDNHSGSICCCAHSCSRPGEACSAAVPQKVGPQRPKTGPRKCTAKPISGHGTKIAATPLEQPWESLPAARTTAERRVFVPVGAPFLRYAAVSASSRARTRSIVRCCCADRRVPQLTPPPIPALPPT